MTVVRCECGEPNAVTWLTCRNCGRDLVVDWHALGYPEGYVPFIRMPHLVSSAFEISDGKPTNERMRDAIRDYEPEE